MIYNYSNIINANVCMYLIDYILIENEKDFFFVIDTFFSVELAVFGNFFYQKQATLFVSAISYKLTQKIRLPYNNRKKKLNCIYWPAFKNYFTNRNWHYFWASQAIFKRCTIWTTWFFIFMWGMINKFRLYPLESKATYIFNIKYFKIN